MRDAQVSKITKRRAVRVGNSAEIYTNTYSLRLPASLSAGTSSHLQGLGDRFRLAGCRMGTGSCVIEKPHSQVKRCQITPQPRWNSASKGLRAAAAFGRRRGRLGTPSNSISQVSGRWGREGGGRRREEGRRLRKRLFLVEQTNPVGVKREEKTPTCKQTAGRSLTGCSSHPPHPPLSK